MESLMSSWGKKNNEQQMLDTLRELFAEQNKTLAQHTQLLAQQVQRIDLMNTQVATLAVQQEALRNDFNKRWDDLPKLYVPRQEHQAMGLDARMVAMEEFRVAATKDISDLKLSVQQQVQTAIQTATKELMSAQLLIQKDTSEQRFTLDGRSITMLTTIVFTLISIALTLIFHFVP
jgi:hypothetical protein